ncbi:glycosyltransferase family 4 protein [Cohnella zeiphila]|uniref:Glycosyltransferase family 4 protein n=1 Tax=Cohnella zeiphila TaxID=2761120 RepID=A0A7X0SMF2_9BACL|nr:glycosyltransferase family 4 protein [Cohnella zeiphila]MBB6732574.1 glycosyltransferase family 4 protein [Cohnella zeiphila]
MTGAKPKLLLFSHICSPIYVTGAEKLLLSFAKELNRSFDCVLVVPREGAIAQAARQFGIPVETLDLPLCIALYVALPHLENELNDLIQSHAWAPLVELLMRHRPAYVWANTCVHPLPAIAAGALGIPVIWALMETINPNSHRAHAAGVIETNSDRIVGISRTVLEPLQGVATPGKMLVLPPFINRDELLPDTWEAHRQRHRRSHGWGEHHRVAGYIASTIYPNKGLKEFVEAVLPIAAADSRVRLLIVGNSSDDEYTASCRQLIRKAGLEDRAAWVRFAERIEAVYPAMDVVIVPSLLKEGFGMAALEGMTFGKPVISFASGGLSEIHEATGSTEYLVAPGDVPGLRRLAQALLSDDGLRAETGRRNEMAARLSFGIDAFRGRLDAFIGQLPPPSDGQLFSSGLVRGSDPSVYWIEQAKKRPFPSDEHLRQHGFRFEDIMTIPDERLRKFPNGTPMFFVGEMQQPPSGPPAGAPPAKGRSTRRRRRASRSERTRARLSRGRKKARTRSRAKPRARPGRRMRRAGRRRRAGAKRLRR